MLGHNKLWVCYYIKFEILVSPVFVNVFVFHSLQEKEQALNKERKGKLKEWSVKLEALQRILLEQENAFKLREGIATDLETVKFKKSEIEVTLPRLICVESNFMNFKLFFCLVQAMISGYVERIRTWT